MSDVENEQFENGGGTHLAPPQKELSDEKIKQLKEAIFAMTWPTFVGLLGNIGMDKATFSRDHSPQLRLFDFEQQMAVLRLRWAEVEPNFPKGVRFLEGTRGPSPEDPATALRREILKEASICREILQKLESTSLAFASKFLP
jgi:hypothetical protein